MELVYAFLAEGVDLQQGGRFFVFGGGLEIAQAPQFPATLPSLALLVKLRFREDEYDTQHQLRITSETPEGAEWNPTFESAFGPVPRAPDGRPRRYHVAALTYKVVSLQTEGIHLIRIFVDAIELGSVGLFAEIVRANEGDRLVSQLTPETEDKNLAPSD